MKPAIVLALIIGSGFAAPIEENEELFREKKSYGSPCGGGAPIALYLSQGPQHYREEEHIEDFHARSNYESALGGLGGYSGANLAGYSGGSGLAGSGSHGLALVGSGVGGSAIGLFPNAKVGGCNIPLLLSCAPNVVTGHLAESHGYGGSGYSAPAYRSFEEEGMLARKASHHKVSEDFPEHAGAPAGHYVVSQDFPDPNLTRVKPVSSDVKPGKV